MSEVSTKLMALKFMLVGIAGIGIGVSQAIYGWVGTGLFFRILYPALCIPFGLLAFGVALIMFLAKDESQVKTDQPIGEKGGKSDEPIGENVLSSAGPALQNYQPSANSPKPEGTSHTGAYAGALAVLLLLGGLGLKFGGALLEHSQKQQEKQRNTMRTSQQEMQKISDAVAKRKLELKKVVDKMTAAGITPEEQELFFQSFLPPDQRGGRHVGGGLQILMGEKDWKGVVDWDFDALNRKADELTQKKHFESDVNSADQQRVGN